jgi:hypothetical protein
MALFERRLLICPLISPTGWQETAKQTEEGLNKIIHLIINDKA